MEQPKKSTGIQWFDSFEEADEADRAYYRSLTPEERLDILIQLIEQHYGPSQGLVPVFEWIELEQR